MSADDVTAQAKTRHKSVSFHQVQSGFSQWQCGFYRDTTSIESTKRTTNIEHKQRKRKQEIKSNQQNIKCKQVRVHKLPFDFSTN